jgi:hypothetical protein
MDMRVTLTRSDLVTRLFARGKRAFSVPAHPFTIDNVSLFILNGTSLFLFVFGEGEDFRVTAFSPKEKKIQKS